MVVALHASKMSCAVPTCALTLARDCDLIAIKYLKVQNMLPSANGTLDNQDRNRGHSLQTTYRTMQPLSTLLVVIGTYLEPTSRTCSRCGGTIAHDRKSQAVFACSTCGYSANVDIHADFKIVAVGLGLLWEVARRRATPHPHVHIGPVRSTPRRRSGMSRWFSKIPWADLQGGC